MALALSATCPLGPPAGVVFGCNRSSEEESLNGLFGMSSGHWSLVQRITHGTPCFLYNFNTKVCYIVVNLQIADTFSNQMRLTLLENLKLLSCCDYFFKALLC